MLLHPAPGFITGNTYGPRGPVRDAFGRLIKTSSFHGGQDFYPSPGKSRTIVAAADGVIVASPYNETAGNAVCIRHDGLPGVEATGYAHLATILLPVGTRVRAGQPIGVAGTTGSSTGVHLHFDVFADLETFARINPLPLIGGKASAPAAPATARPRRRPMGLTRTTKGAIALNAPGCKPVTLSPKELPIVQAYLQHVAYGEPHGWLDLNDQQQMTLSSVFRRMKE